MQGWCLYLDALFLYHLHAPTVVEEQRAMQVGEIQEDAGSLELKALRCLGAVHSITAYN